MEQLIIKFFYSIVVLIIPFIVGQIANTFFEIYFFTDLSVIIFMGCGALTGCLLFEIWKAKELND